MSHLLLRTIGAAKVFRVPLGRLGLSKRDLRKVYSLRRQLEEDAVESGGEVSRVGALRLYASLTAFAEVLAAQAMRSKAQKGETTLPLDHERWLSDSIGKNTDRCVRHLVAMGLDGGPKRRESVAEIVHSLTAVQAAVPADPSSNGRPATESAPTFAPDAPGVDCAPGKGIGVDVDQGDGAVTDHGGQA